jgi:hypothetical protein
VITRLDDEAVSIKPKRTNGPKLSPSPRPEEKSEETKSNNIKW